MKQTLLWPYDYLSNLIDKLKYAKQMLTTNDLNAYVNVDLHAK